MGAGGIGFDHFRGDHDACGWEFGDQGAAEADTGQGLRASPVPGDFTGLGGEAGSGAVGGEQEAERAEAGAPGVAERPGKSLYVPAMAAQSGKFPRLGGDEEQRFHVSSIRWSGTTP